jgi:hypothetical protein
MPFIRAFQRTRAAVGELAAVTYAQLADGPAGAFQSVDSHPMNKAYRALVQRAPVASGGARLHLIREDAEASLCAIPRPHLASGGPFDELLCPDCLEWLPRRMEASRKLRKAQPS